MPEVVLRFGGDNVSATRSVRQLLEELQGVRTETHAVGAASKETGVSIQEQARLNITKAIEQRDALRGLVQEYATVAKAAAVGSDEAIQANRLWMESNAKLAATYDAVGASAKIAARDAAAASVRAREESGVARGFASRTIGVGAFAGTAFIAGAIGGLIVKKATDEAQRAQESQVQLRNALDRTGQSYDAQRESIERYLEKAEEASAFDRIDLRTSLGLLVRATGDTSKAQDLLSQATDVARGRHISLDAAVRLVTRAYQGNVGMLRRVGIDVQAVTTAQDKLREAHVKVTPEMTRQAAAIDKQATATKALALLNDRYSGAAAAHARTLAGREEALGNAFTDVSVSIGKAVTPALTSMFEWMAKTVRQAQHSKDVHEVLHVTFQVIGFVIRDLIVPQIRFAIAEWKFWIRVTRDVVDFVRGDLIPAFRSFYHFILSTGRAAWAAVVQTAKGAVYIILQAATSAIRGVLEVASHLPFVGDKARAALDSINHYLDHWKPDFGKVDAAFRAGGTSAGQAFADAAQKAMENIKPGTVIGPHRAGPRGEMQGTYVATGGGVQGGLVKTGLTALGNPYQYGGAPSLSSPTDCSGLMVAIFAKHGISLPRTSEAQYASAPIKNARPLAVGDLVFSEGVHPGHVGLYIGQGKVLEDPHTGDHVKIVPLSGFGWNGESARWWGGRARGGGGGGGRAGAATPSIGQVIAQGTPDAAPAAPAYKGPTGDDLLPVALVRRARRFANAAARDLSAAGSSTGLDVADFYEQAARDLRREEGVLRQEVRSLDRKLKGASGGRRKAIESEISKVEGQIASVHKAVTSALGQEENALQSVVSTLQSTVSTAFSSISQAIVAKFEANTQALIDQVGKQFFQGALTPEERRYQAAQTGDQVKSLQDALAQATATGDPTQIAAAKHAIDMYNLEAAAAASRARADADYAAAVAKIQREREAAEEHLTVALDRFGSGLQDGTERFSDLQPLLDHYGVRLSNLSSSSFIFKTNLDSLADSARELDRALVDLADLVAQITGKPVHHPRHHHHRGASGGGGSTGGGGGASEPAPPLPAFAGGGFVGGPMIGPEDTIVARVSTGEGVVSRDLMRHLILAATDRAAPAQRYGPVQTAPIYVLGANEQQVGRALERIVTPSQARRAGFRNY